MTQKPVRQQIFASRVALGGPTFRTSSSVAFLSTSSICLASAEVIWADRKAEPAFSAVTPDLPASAQRWQPPPDPQLATAAQAQPPSPRSREAGFRLFHGRGEEFDRTPGKFGCLQEQARQAAARTARMRQVSGMPDQASWVRRLEHIKKTELRCVYRVVGPGAGSLTMACLYAWEAARKRTPPPATRRLARSLAACTSELLPHDRGHELHPLCDQPRAPARKHAPGSVFFSGAAAHHDKEA